MIIMKKKINIGLKFKTLDAIQELSIIRKLIKTTLIPELLVVSYI